MTAYRVLVILWAGVAICVVAIALTTDEFPFAAKTPDFISQSN